MLHGKVKPVIRVDKLTKIKVEQQMIQYLYLYNYIDLDFTFEVLGIPI